MSDGIYGIYASWQSLLLVYGYFVDDSPDWMLSPVPKLHNGTPLLLVSKLYR